MAAASEQQMEVWVETVTCDGCKEVIIGKFNVCSECQSVDLCAKCFPKRKQIHPEHTNWHRGTRPQPVPVAPVEKRTAPASPSLAERVQHVRGKLSPPNKKAAIDGADGASEQQPALAALTNPSKSSDVASEVHVIKSKGEEGALATLVAGGG
eukprot:12199987-Alexandrium_andersonii.AAC.1